MTKMFSYSQRIQLALLVLLASLCLNFGQLLGHFKQQAHQQISTTRGPSDRG
ncbi:MAG: hypothetical protein U0931_41100 [Vulcanimicrobiota bacterium]